METKFNIQSMLQTFVSVENESLFIDQLYGFLDMNIKDELDSRLKELKHIDQIRKIKVENLSYKYQKDGGYPKSCGNTLWGCI